MTDLYDVPIGELVTEINRRRAIISGKPVDKIDGMANVLGMTSVELCYHAKAVCKSPDDFFMDIIRGRRT